MNAPGTPRRRKPRGRGGSERPRRSGRADEVAGLLIAGILRDRGYSTLGRPGDAATRPRHEKWARLGTLAARGPLIGKYAGRTGRDDRRGRAAPPRRSHEPHCSHVRGLPSRYLPSHQVTTRTDVVKVGRAVRAPTSRSPTASGDARRHREVAGPEAITLVDLRARGGHPRQRRRRLKVPASASEIGSRSATPPWCRGAGRAGHRHADRPPRRAPDAAAASPAPFAVAAAPRGAAPNPFAADFPVGIHNPFAAALARDAAASVVAEDGCARHLHLRDDPARPRRQRRRGGAPDQEATER
jgi:hypothetical protein